MRGGWPIAGNPRGIRMIISRKRHNTSFSAFQVRKHRPDYWIIVIAGLLLAIGLIVMYAISPALASTGSKSGGYYVERQFVAIVLGLLAFFAASKISLSTWEKWQKWLIGIAFVLCIVTVLSGGMANRWIPLGSFSFQPVELVKFVFIVSGPIFLAKAIKTGEIAKLKALRPLIVAFLIFSLIIIVLQRDLGSAFVLFAMAGVLAYAAGVPLKKLALFSVLIIGVIVLAISSTSYRRERLLTFLQPDKDCATTGYHACQAMIAVGSGGLFGAGLGHSVQAYGYLPMADNDSIFAIYAEKFGFVGGVVLLALFGILLLRILKIMQRAPNKTTQLVCGAVFAWIGVQTLVNVGAMLGLLPLKGITLPFISAGGTSLIFSMMALGIVFQISAYSSMRASTISLDNERGSNEIPNHWRRDSRPRYTVTRSS
jgi:cell division protein FtsW